MQPAVAWTQLQVGVGDPVGPRAVQHVAGASRRGESLGERQFGPWPALGADAPGVWEGHTTLGQGQSWAWNLPGQPASTRRRPAKAI